MKLTESTIQEARELLKRHAYGVLSTSSVSLSGTPFGSIATYCVDQNGRVIFLFSTIAEHSKNLAADQRGSLTVLEGGEGSVQAQARVTLSGKITKLDSEEQVAERYFRYFPEAREYREFHDFEFYSMSLSKVRYIGGFGKIHWIEPEDFEREDLLSEKEESMIIEHMNSQHRDSLVSYFSLLKGMTLTGEEQVEMCGIDADGFDVLMDGGHYRFNTDEPMNDAVIARKVLTDLSKKAAAAVL